MLRSLYAKRFDLEATARFGSSVSQAGSAGCTQISAIASAIPKHRSLAILTLGSANHRQLGETLTAGDIDQIIFANRPLETPTRPGSGIRTQGVATGDLLIATVANAQPSRFGAFAGRPSVTRNNLQIAEALSHEIMGSSTIAISYRHADNVSDGMLIVQRRS
jgi:hypothetical protein